MCYVIPEIVSELNVKISIFRLHFREGYIKIRIKILSPKTFLKNKNFLSKVVDRIF